MTNLQMKTALSNHLVLRGLLLYLDKKLVPCHRPILIHALTHKFEFKPSSDRTSLPLHHIFSTPAGVFIHHHLPLAQHRRQRGEERFVPLDVAHKLPAGSSGFQEVIKNYQTRRNYTVQPVLPHSSRFSN